MRQDLGLVRGQVCQQPAGLGIPDNGTPGHLDDQILCRLAGAVAGAAILPTLCHILALITEINQGGKIIVHHEYNIAALAAVAAVRAACCYILFPVKGNSAIAAVSRLDFNFRLINKHMLPHSDRASARHLITQ